jgi:WD40 repeat protein
MQYLVAGYKSGAVALWDLRTYKLEKLMPDVHETEVTGAKIYHITDENIINIVSAEAKGRVYKVEVSYKGFFSGTTYTKVSLYEKRLITTTTVAVH